MTKFNTYLQAVQSAEKSLVEAGHDGYDAQFVLMEKHGWNLTDWVENMNQPMPEFEERIFDYDVKELLENVPAQYIVGSSEFYGRRFRVTKDTLIPRPETEELVQLVLQVGADDLPLNVLDIGTGSGAIAISIAAEKPQWHVFATDISDGALAIAKQNATTLDTQIDFELGDTLTPFLENKKFDLIVSNPPYISVDEWADMDKSVREYEPKTALFAEDDGLAIYKRIAELAPNVILPTSQLFFEIGFRQGEAVKEIFATAFPNREVEIIQDMSKLDRIIYVHEEN
jgi:release factor glutamine methyltransferase